jgi:hypothetical protein
MPRTPVGQDGSFRSGRPQAGPLTQARPNQADQGKDLLRARTARHQVTARRSLIDHWEEACVLLQLRFVHEDLGRAHS